MVPISIKLYENFYWIFNLPSLHCLHTSNGCNVNLSNKCFLNLNLNLNQWSYSVGKVPSHNCLKVIMTHLYILPNKDVLGIKTKPHSSDIKCGENRFGFCINSIKPSKFNGDWLTTQQWHLHPLIWLHHVISDSSMTFQIEFRKVMGLES